MYVHTNLVCYSRGRLAPILVGFASESLLLPAKLCRGGRQREYYTHEEEQDGGRGSLNWGGGGGGGADGGERRKRVKTYMGQNNENFIQGQVSIFRG